MAEETPRTLNHLAAYAFRERYWRLGQSARAEFHHAWLEGLRAAAEAVHVYQLFPSEAGADVLVWCAIRAPESRDTAHFFERYARAVTPFRSLLETTAALWGYTRPSQYTKTRSAQELDPFSAVRPAYLVVYPFTKTTEWYLMSRETRQGMMNEHIKIGKQYPAVRQLLLYSTGLQDQEFVVVYEMADLTRFSQLVTELRSTQGRAYTLGDTPVHTAVYHPAEETLALFR